ncbi:MAG: helix-turn-helix transcriptional regulator [Tenericutes bacterium]|nr:helix-turn-helix transcriptional regulator [Mycoplasmatota bacterium]
MSSDIYTNYLVELKRGTQIIVVLSQLFDKEYGYSLLQKLIDKGVAIEAGTLYPLLRRLESQGILISEWDTTMNRPRKYYSLSEEGLKLYDYLLDEYFGMVKDVSKIVGGKNNE